LEEALAYRKRYSEESTIVAGGKRGLILPQKLIDISRLDLDYVRREPTGFAVGSMTKLRQFLDHEELMEPIEYGALSECVKEFRPHQVRNVATVGGQLCSGYSAFDLPPVLLALDSKVKMRSLEGERSLALDKFFLGYFETALAPGEILTELHIPHPSKGTGSAFEKFERTSVDLATVNVAVKVTVEKGKCIDARIWLGAISNTPVRALQGEEVLRGKRIEDETITHASQTVSSEIKPTDSLTGSAEYKKHLSMVITKRALTRAADNIERSRKERGNII
jgi:carbon-monoxide dehydrogenase medium subunit